MVGTFSIRPIQVGFAVLMRLLTLCLTGVLTGVCFAQFLAGSSFLRDNDSIEAVIVDIDGTLLKKVIFPAVDNQVKDEVYDEKTSCPVHARWIELLCRAERAKPGQERQGKSDEVQRVHQSEVPERLLTESDAWRTRQSVQDLVEAQEVEVV